MLAESTSSAWQCRDASTPLSIGFLAYADMNQLDLTGPYEVFARMPHTSLHIIGHSTSPVREERGLLILPTTTLTSCPPLDLLVVPGGRGQESLMRDSSLLSFLRAQSLLFSVCTGALLCGAAGLLVGRRATTHWAAMHVLPYYGASPSPARVTVDGPIISSAGVTAGIDGALHIVGLLQGLHCAGEVELALQYSPEPPLRCGDPSIAPPAVLASTTAKYQKLADERVETAKALAVVPFSEVEPPIPPCL